MNEIWADPANWTIEQWLSVAILGFILLAILVMIHRLLAILNMSRKSTYRPNFRRLRRVHHDVMHHAAPGMEADDDSEESAK